MPFEFKKSLTKTPVVPKGLPKRAVFKPPARPSMNGEIKGAMPKTADPFRERAYTPPEIVRKPIEKNTHEKATVLRGLDDEPKKEEKEDTSLPMDDADEPKRKSYEINLESNQVKGFMGTIQQIFKQFFG